MTITEVSRERYAALEELIRRKGKGRWLVLTHDNPDPDALASAQLLARVLRQALKQAVTVAYGGIVGRAENRAMRTFLSIDLVPVCEVKLDGDAQVVLVDTQP
ncbi:MAG TPA: bifunctional oligoribonuclease/PAP phosphatase NrnA, partial [Thermoanaerobaculia bacterium]